MIAIENLHKSFGKNRILKGINLAIDQAGILAVLGPNGSGKTTLIKSILGMVIPDQGKITFDGENIAGKSHYRNQIGYLPQIARFPENLTVAELLSMVRDLRDSRANDEKLAEILDLKPYLQHRLRNLSGGTRQKVNLMLTFMYDSPVMILDEPTSGLDPVAMIRLRELIQTEKRRGKIIIITTHIMSFVEEIADRIIFLLEGEIRFRGTREVLLSQTGEADLEHAIASLLTRNTTHITHENHKHHVQDLQIQLL